MLHALFDLLGGIGEGVAAQSLTGAVGDAVARVIDDFKRNRATETRLREAEQEDSSNHRDAAKR
jgi:hypothetical protein